VALVPKTGDYLTDGKTLVLVVRKRTGGGWTVEDCVTEKRSVMTHHDLFGWRRVKQEAVA
jgi:hypothetical protein